MKRRTARYLVVGVMSWAHGCWCLVVVADRMLGPEMNGGPWDGVGSGANAGVKRGEMGGGEEMD